MKDKTYFRPLSVGVFMITQLQKVHLTSSIQFLYDFITGSKRVFAGDFSRGYCVKQRFQPFVFWTNGSVSDCIFVKSICSEEGQVVYQNNSSKDDRTCRCNYKKSYAFIQKPRNDCYCIPTEEECSCYIKSCPENYTLSAGISLLIRFLVK